VACCILTIRSSGPRTECRAKLVALRPRPLTSSVRLRAGLGFLVQVQVCCARVVAFSSRRFRVSLGRPALLLVHAAHRTRTRVTHAGARHGRSGRVKHSPPCAFRSNLRGVPLMFGRAFKRRPRPHAFVAPLAVHTLSSLRCRTGHRSSSASAGHWPNYSLKRTAEDRLRYYHASAAAAA
jgi:hypothetical protein